MAGWLHRVSGTRLAYSTGDKVQSLFARLGFLTNENRSPGLRDSLMLSRLSSSAKAGDLILVRGAVWAGVHRQDSSVVNLKKGRMVLPGNNRYLGGFS